MPDGRGYAIPTIKGLFALSRGTCYAPGCPQPVVRMSGTNPITNVQIAHIHAVKKGGPRYKEMTGQALEAFANLVLLCTFHHNLVDGKKTWQDYSADTLRKWKADRELGLTGLDNLTQQQLETNLLDAVESVVETTRDQVVAAIKNVRDISQETAELLRRLADRVFNSPTIDLEAVASLADSAYILNEVTEYIPMLHESSQSLSATLPDYAPMLYRSSQGLLSFSDYIGMLHYTSRSLDNLADYAPQLRDAAIRIDELPDRTSVLRSALEDARHTVNQFERVVTQLASQLDNRRYLSDLQSAAGELATYLSELSDKSHAMANLASVITEESNTQTPDRWTYIKAGLIAGALIGSFIIGVAWYLVANHGH